MASDNDEDNTVALCAPAILSTEGCWPHVRLLPDWYKAGRCTPAARHHHCLACRLMFIAQSISAQRSSGQIQVPTYILQFATALWGPSTAALLQTSRTSAAA